MPNNSGFIRSGLVRSADLVANNARERTLNGYPKGDERGAGISESIKVSEVIDNGDELKIQIYISTDESPAALAYEFGSGEHGERGETYEITPNPPKEALAFFWEKKGENVVFSKVDHPGIEARPYMSKALEEEEGNIISILGDEVLMGLSVDFGEDVQIIR